MRIPWLILGFRDPSRKEVMADFVAAKDISKGQFIEDIGNCFAFNTPDAALLPPTPARRFTWKNWDRLEGVPPLKQSYPILRDFFATIG